MARPPVVSTGVSPGVIFAMYPSKKSTGRVRLTRPAAAARPERGARPGSMRAAAAKKRPVFSLPWVERVLVFVACPPRLARVCRWFRERLSEPSSWHLVVRRVPGVPLTRMRRWGASSVLFHQHDYHEHVPHLQNMRHMEVRCHSIVSPFRLAGVRRLTSLRLGGIHLHDLGPLFEELPRMQNLAVLELKVEHLYYYTRGVESWDRFPPRLRALVTNVPLRMEDLPVRELRRVELTEKSVILEKSGWHRVVKPRVWSAAGELGEGGQSGSTFSCAQE